MKNRIVSLVLALSTVISVFMSNNISQAATRPTSNTNTDGVATVTKSAKWTNEGKTEAEITIEVQTKKLTEEIDKVHDADIIFLLDSSLSAGRNINLQHDDMINYVMKDATKYFITGDYENKNNSVAYAEFSSALLVWDGSNVSDGTSNLDKMLNRPIHYSYNSMETGNYGFNYSHNNSDYSEKISGNLGLLTKYGQITYSEAKSRFSKIIKAYPNALKLYSSNNEDIELLDNVFRKSLNTNVYSANTNFDMGLFYAQTLLNNRTDKDRQSYVIFVTDGQPFPNIRYSNATYEWYGNGNSYKNADNVANLFYEKISNDLRKNGTEIYSIIVDTTDEGASQVVTEVPGYAHVTEETTGKNWYNIVWNVITGDTESGKDKNTEHVYSVVKKENKVKTAESMMDILHDIESKMKEKISSSIPLKAELTDIINTDIFNVRSSKNAITTNIGEAQLSEDGQTVTWNFSDINYGSKCSDGKWPTLKIKLNLKDTKKYGDDLNTNSIKDGDDKCELIHTEGDGVKVPTPWLERPAPENESVIIKYIDDETDEVLYSVAFDEIKKGSVFPSSSTIKNLYALDRRRIKESVWY